MVIKGKSVAGAARLSVHLQRRDTNERVEVLELRGVAAEDLDGALAEMDAVATGTRCTKPFYHASLNTRADERLTDEQRFRAIDRLEQELGLAGQPRAVVLHEKEGREHCHMVWSRINLDKMTAISDSHNYRKHELVAREMERAFGHERVQGAHIERDGQPRPNRTPGHDEMQQAGRSGLSPAAAKDFISGLWRRTDNGHAFRTALEEKEWLLARGDRRDFVAVDPAGTAHSLARRVEGAKAKDIRERMSDLAAAGLPSVAEARRLLQERDKIRNGRVGVTQDFETPPEPVRVPPAATPAPEPARAGPPPVLEPAAPSDRAADLGQVMGQGAQGASKGLFVAAEGAARAAEKLTDFVAGLTESFSGPPPRQYQAAELARDPAARRAHYAQQAAERESDEALDRMRRDTESGKMLRPDDVRALTHAHLLQIKAHGDDYLRQVIADHEKDQARSSGLERERER